MDTQNRPKLALQQDASEERRTYVLTDADWLELSAFVVEFLLRGGSPMLYHSKDGNALCLSLKSGKEGKRYWIGPDDLAPDVLTRAMKDWGVYVSPDNPVVLAAMDLSQEALERLQNAGLEDE